MTEEYFPQVMDVSEVADYPTVIPAAIFGLALAGKIPCSKVGRVGVSVINKLSSGYRSNLIGQ